MKYLKVTDPIWDQNHQMINCTVTFEQWPNEPLLFSARINDIEPHGRSIYLECVFGLYGEVKEPLTPPTEIKGIKKWFFGLKKAVLGK